MPGEKEKKTWLQKTMNKVSQKRHLIVGIVIGIILIALAPYIYVSILNQSVSDPFFSECLDLQYNRRLNYTTFCIDREQPQYLSCILSIAPSKAKQKHVLVVGSRTPIGMSLVSELRSREIPYVEIKGRAQLNLNVMSSYEVIRSVEYSCILICIDKLEDPAYLQALVRHLKIPTYSFYPELGLRDFTITIDTPRIIGPQFMSLHNEFWNIIVQRCHLMESPVMNELDQSLISSKTAASLVIGKLLPYIQGETTKYPESITLTPTTTMAKVISTIVAKYPKCNIKLNGKRVHGEIDEESIEAIDFASSQFSVTNEAYLSLVYVANELDDSTEYMNKELSWLDGYVKKYPSTPIEVIIVMMTHTKGMDVIYPKDAIKPHVRMVMVPSDQSPDKKSNFEYIMRNIGIRRATGKFIVTGRADSLVPISLLDAARRHELSVMSVIRSESNVQFMKYEQASTTIIPAPVTQQLIDWKDPFADVGTNIEEHSILQGCHRKMWDAIAGYAEGPWYSEVDTALMLEFPAFTEKTFVQRFSGTLQYSVSIKPKTAGFPNIKKIAGVAACKGVSPKKIVGAKYKNWGMNNKKLRIISYF